MRALVTGGNGFIGSILVERLVQENKVRCLVRKTSNLRWIEHLPIDLVYGELRNPASLRAAVADVDIVFHLAGVTRGRVEADYMDGNYKATQNLLEACAASDSLQSFVFVSSQAAGGPSRDQIPVTEDEAHQPVSAYGRAKRRAEEAVLQTAPFPTTVIRPPSVYGPRDKDFFVLFKNIQKGILPMVGRGDQRISMVYISDLIDGILLAATTESAHGHIFNICSDEAVSFWHLATTISETLSKRPLVLRLPLWLVDYASRISEGVSRFSGKASLLNRDKVTELRQPSWLVSNQKAKKLLGFMPRVSLNEGLQTTADWYRDHHWL